MKLRRLITRMPIALLTAALAVVLAPTRGGSVAYATNQTPPTFPSCQSVTPPGDWVNSIHGFHHIPGQEATIEGSDDVYYLEGGNFVQCLCPVEGTTGIQTNWWNIGDASFSLSGWYNEFGGNWNLLQVNYLAQNVNYQCRAPEPTPTPSNPPRGGDNPPSNTRSRCEELTPSVYGGTAPLTIQFAARGYDTSGTIQEYKFNFHDVSGGQPAIWQTNDNYAYHRFENPGVYQVDVTLRDTRNDWITSDGCRVQIEVFEHPQVLGGSSVGELPKTGGWGIVAGLFAPIAGIVGFALYRRFRLV